MIVLVTLSIMVILVVVLILMPLGVVIICRFMMCGHWSCCCCPGGSVCRVHLWVGIIHLLVISMGWINAWSCVYLSWGWILVRGALACMCS